MESYSRSNETRTTTSATRWNGASLAGPRTGSGIRFVPSPQAVPQGHRVADQAVRPTVAKEQAERIRDAVEAVVARTVDGEVASVRAELARTVVESLEATLAWDDVESSATRSSLDRLRDALVTCETTDATGLDASLRDRLHVAPPPPGSTVDVRTDPATATTRIRWTSADRSEVDGRVVLVAVGGAQVGDGNRQVNVFCRVVDDPDVDFGALMEDGPVAEALAALSADPCDAELRRAAVGELTRAARADAAEDWTLAYAGGGSVESASGGPDLDGTVAIIRSRGIQVGDRMVQENVIEHTVSPTVAAGALLAGDGELVDRLVALVAEPGDRGAAVAFERAMGRTLVDDLARSRASRAGHGTVHRPPRAGVTLTIGDTAGVSVGRRVSQKTRFAQTAHVGRTARRSTARYLDATGGG